jgi:hypothetical protein
LRVHRDVRLHPKIPLVALLRLVHLGVALTFPVLRRGRRGDDRRVHDRALLHQALLRAQHGVDLRQDSPRQVVPFQQVPELQKRRRIRHPFGAQVDAHKQPHRLAVVDRVLQRFVGQSIPLLQKIHPQHPFHPLRRTAPRAFRIMRLDQCF